MEPRLPTSLSKNRVKFPPDALKILKESLQENYPQLKDQEIQTDGYLHPLEILIRFGLREKDALRILNFECSMDFDKEKQNPVDLMHLAADALQGMMDQFLEADGDIELPTVWTKFDLETKSVWLKTTTVDYVLEAQANALLGEEFLEQEANFTEEDLDNLFSQLRKADRPDFSH